MNAQEKATEIGLAFVESMKRELMRPGAGDLEFKEAVKQSLEQLRVDIAAALTEAAQQPSDEVVVYVEWHGESFQGSQEDALKTQRYMATVWLAKREELSTLWGDDWNDAPWWCNAGQPYEHLTPSLRKVELYLGKPLATTLAAVKKEYDL